MGDRGKHEVPTSVRFIKKGGLAEGPVPQHGLGNDGVTLREEEETVTLQYLGQELNERVVGQVLHLLDGTDLKDGQLAPQGLTSQNRFREGTHPKGGFPTGGGAFL